MKDLDSIFLKARELSAEQQRTFLDQVCEGDAGLRARIERMLRKTHQAEAFFEQTPGSDEDIPRANGETDGPIQIGEDEGSTIGRYKLLQKIGEGGMGAVYMAEQEEPVRRRVALKIIKLGMDTKQVVARFEIERQALAMMDHPNIARVIDGGATDTGRPYFVMELVQGVPITEFSDRNKLSLRERLDLFMPVCKAIQSAHQKGIIHRDIKPSNVMVTLNHGEPMPKVIDFGVAKATDQKLTEKTVFTHYGTMIGTPAYMSPEQAEMTSLDVDTRTDVYSLGVLLYELLTGTTPFPEKRLRSLGYGQIQRVIAEEEPEKPSTRMSTIAGEEKTNIAENRGRNATELGGEIRGDLDWIVMKCLEKDRRRRYETPNELVADLQRHLTNEPVAARSPSVGYRFQKAWQRNKLAFIAVGLLVLGVVASTWQAVRAKRAERLAGQRLAEAVAERDAKEKVSLETKFVGTFFSDLFANSDPAHDARTVTLTKLLNAATKIFVFNTSVSPFNQTSMAVALGQAYYDLGFYRESIPLREHALAYCQETHGPEHHHTLTHSQYLGVSYYAVGRLKDAIPLQEEALATRIKISGLEEFNTVWSMINLANSYAADGRAEEALALREKLLPIAQKVFPTNHSYRLDAMDQLASSRFDAGRRTEALAMMEKSLTLHRSILGENHPSTILSMGNLARHYRQVGRRDEALKLRESALARSHEVSGPEHPATLRLMSDWAESCLDANRQDEALATMEEVAALRRKASGLEDPETRNALRSLAALCRENGDEAKALALETEIAISQSAAQTK